MNIEAIRIRDYWSGPNGRGAVADILALCDEVERLRGVAHDFADELHVKSIRIAELEAELTSLKGAVKTLREALMESELVVVQFAVANPIWYDHGYGRQDPGGAHRLVGEIRTALEATKEAGDAD